MCGGAFGETILWTEEMVAGYKEPWERWANSTLGDKENEGYNTMVATINKNIYLLELVQAYIYGWKEFLSESKMLVTVTGTKNGAHDITNVDSFEASIWFDCNKVTGKTSSLAGFAGTSGTSGVEGVTEYQKKLLQIEYAKKYYDSWKIPETVEVEAIFGATEVIAGVTAQTKAGIHRNKDFLLITKDSEIDLEIIPVSSLPSSSSFTFSFSIPTGNEKETPYIDFASIPSSGYDCSMIKNIMFKKKKHGELCLRYKARDIVYPTQWGGVIDPITVEDNMIMDYGGLRVNHDIPYENNFCEQYIAFGDSPQSQLNGFSKFAGINDGHPLVTGNDIYTLSNSVKFSDLVDVNNEVVDKYFYEAEYIRSDYWRFLTSVLSTGGCEDFAVTKAQGLLERGWSVKCLHLELGWRTDQSELYFGLVWLVVDWGGREYALVGDEHEITTRANMRFLYPLTGAYQISGCTWKMGIDFDFEEFTVEKAKRRIINIPVLGFNATIEGR